MVKIPSFDDLKKAGAGLIDQAKSVDLGGMVNKVKAGIDSVTVKKDGGTSASQGDNDIKAQFQILYASLAELTHLQAAQAAQIKKVEAQLALLSKAVAAMPASNVAESTVTPGTIDKNEEKKDL